MEHIKSFLEHKLDKYGVHDDKNKNSVNYYEYVVCISDTGFGTDHQYYVEDYWGPLRTDNTAVDEKNKVKTILGKHKCDKNTTCYVKIMDGEDLIRLL